MEKKHTGTPKVIIPLKETERDGSKFTDPRVRKVPTEKVSSSYHASEGDFVLDWKNKNGRPYIADMLASRFLYDQNITKKEMDTIDEYVNLEILRRGLNGRKESYKEVVDELSKKLKISKNSSPEEKVRKLATILEKAVEQLKIYKKLGLSLPTLEEIYGG